MPPLRQREEIRRALLSPGQPAFVYVKERVAAEDIAALRVLRDGNTPLHRLLTPRAAAASSVRSLVGRRPFLSEEPAATQSLRASAAMGLALVDDSGRSADELATGLLWLRANHAHPGHERSSPQELLKRTDAGHATRLRRLMDAVPAADQDLALSALTWLLALDGALPHSRPTAKATVLFDDGRGGVRGTLALAVLPQGPPALLPDPRTMSGFRGDERFRQSLRDAWDGIVRGITTTVLWSLTDPDGVVGMVEDNSLGCAFAVLLGEVERAGRRLRPPALRRINPRTALVGGLDAARPGALVSVGGYAAKLKAAGEGANVVVPAADRDEARQALPGGTADRLLFAATVGEAARKARVWDFPVVKRVSYTVVATLAVLVLLSLYLANRLGAAGEAEARRALASDLAAEAMLLRETDPRLAALLGLAGYTMEPDTPRAVQAMRDVLEANSGVRLSWRASPKEVHSIAVDDRHGRVYTTGDDPYLKSWDLLTGKELGRTGGAVTDLVLDHASGLLAARDGTAVSVYSALRPVPRLMGRLAAPSCGGKGGKPVANAFAGNGARLVEVLSDGAVAQYDTTTLEEIDCRRTGDVVNQGWLIRAADDSVIDATAAPSPPPALAGQRHDEDKALLLLRSGDVMALGLDTHKLTTEIGSSDVQGNALQIDASDTAVLLATPLGVQAWDRRSRRTLSFPVGGLSYRPRAMVAYAGSVTIAGNDGTALVPVGNSDDRIGSRALEDPRGGPAFTTAVGSLFTVVSGGRGGRVNVLDDRLDPLGLSPTSHADAASFGPDGLLLLAHGGEPFSSDSVYTIDPRTTPEVALNSAMQEYAHVAEYPLRDTFEFRDAAMAGPLVAAVGRSDGNAAAAVVWRGKGADPKVLSVPGPDRVAAAGERVLTTVAFVPEADLLVARHATGPLTIWSTRTWQPVATVPLTAGYGLAVHGTQALALENRGPEGPRIVLVDLTTGTTTRSAAAPGARFLDWSRDGTRIAVLTRDNTVHYRDTALKETGEPLVLPETAEAPTAMVLSPDGRRLAIAVDDQVLVHETATGLQALPTLSAARTGAIRLSWSPDGDFLAGVGRRDDSDYFAAGAATVWRVGGIDWRRQICRWTGGTGLSTEEWRSHIGDRHPYADLCAETK
ncbi:WD40 repeat domain-containing protein [Streptomyces sp. NPDC056188]|uniref:WD40 repeat domain-containing protein n=1 Tax=Streptomyces sp. NPDC056188 TaxID=3345740 RepID=UPI0035E1779B